MLTSAETAPVSQILRRIGRVLGGAIAPHLRIDSPLFTHTQFGLYLGLLLWGGVWLRDSGLRQLLPFRR